MAFRGVGVLNHERKSNIIGLLNYYLLDPCSYFGSHYKQLLAYLITSEVVKLQQHRNTANGMIKQQLYRRSGLATEIEGMRNKKVFRMTAKKLNWMTYCGRTVRILCTRLAHYCLHLCALE